MAKAILAVSGKGGVGKTTVAASVVRILSEREPDAKILAIDADPAIGLSTALGVDVNLTLDDIRKSIVSNVEKGDSKQAIELLGEARFRIIDALVETEHFTFLAIGRPEGAGCFCSINSYLKEIITILAEDFDYVVVDGEAGVEQINRRVMEKVSHLFLISDQSRKSLGVVKTIQSLAQKMVMYEKCGVIMNRVTNPDLLEESLPEGLEWLSTIPMDLSHAANDVRGMSVFELERESPLLRGVTEALMKLGLISSGNEV